MTDTGDAELHDELNAAERSEKLKAILSAIRRIKLAAEIASAPKTSALSPVAAGDRARFLREIDRTLNQIVSIVGTLADAISDSEEAADRNYR